MVTENELIEPTMEKKKLIYEFYNLIYKSEFDMPKKRTLMTAVMGYEKWCWRVVGITKDALKAIADNGLKLPTGLQRDHFKQSRAETYARIFQTKLPFADWWKIVWENDETILMTKKQHDKHKSVNAKDIINIDYKLGYFRDASVGMHYTKKREGEFIKGLCIANGIQIVLPSAKRTAK